MTLATGTRVRTRSQHRDGHTRLPRYLQHASGVVISCLGAFTLPDHAVAHSEHPRKSVLYTVAFPSAAIFPGSENGTICADLFEEYLEAEP